MDAWSTEEPGSKYSPIPHLAFQVPQHSGSVVLWKGHGIGISDSVWVYP